MPNIVNSVLPVVRHAAIELKVFDQQVHLVFSDDARGCLHVPLAVS